MAHSADRRLTGDAARRRRLVAAWVAVVAVAAGAAIWAFAAPRARAAGSAQAAAVIAPIQGDDDVRYVPPSAATPPVVADGRLVAAIVADLTTFWSKALPPITGAPFTPLRGGLTAMDSSAEAGSAPCVSAPADIVGNAYYCPTDDGIVYDATTLIPVVLHRYGIGGLITTFAHEFGHAAQARVNAARVSGGGAASPGAHAAPESLTTEARADCDAGAFVAWALAGRAPHLSLDPGVLAGAIGPLVDFSDPPSVAPTDPTAHGLAIDRLTWFLTGYRGDAKPCADLSGSIVTALGRITAKDDPTAPGRFTDTTAILTAATRSVRLFADSDPEASGGLFVDPPDDRPIEVSPTLLAAAAPFGQFAVATLVAVHFAVGRGSTPAAAACFAGAWVRSVFGHVSATELGGRPADVDEGLAAVLLAPGDTFAAAAGYADGFRGGAAAC